ncbi:MAG: hypothetical protein UT29_C0001G0043 [Candidatus Yanofskybacteria bacterium GW2011_GWA1_39_13]|uniref:Uncharacterized protein n=1 Tax=Yanofskybacteria sp. (strain GW2011_GWA1_39_13) TaxID=1619019 RepID=A0A0G0MHA7_YANXG|nr:MAG: hypothetical protein UT29_C0001G0043 [Candidatus Yanofskybacteria bacterium GW2011_GWA1_39_13]
MEAPVIRRPTNDYERIGRFIQKKGDEQFSLSDIFHVTKISQDVIGAFLLRNLKRGLLKRLNQKRPFLYKRKGGVNIPLRKSKGEVAQSVWAALVAEFPRHVTLQRLAILASSATKTKITKKHARIVVQRWLKNGFVEQSQNRPLYRKKEEVSERPPAVW